MKKAAKISIIVFTVIFAVISATVVFLFLSIDPNVNILNSPELDTSQFAAYTKTVKILDKNGEILDDALYGKNNVYVRLSDIPQYTADAFIAIEDKRFYRHHGVDFYRVGSALLSNIKSGKFKEGASTITQQLIKNTHLSGEKTIKRKLNEMRLARMLENEYSKDKILESYLNILYFGSGIKGLGTASRVFFDKPAAELSVAQSAALASIINNPSRYNPYSGTPDLMSRKDLVLSQMLDQGFITEKEYNAAKNEQLHFGKNRRVQFIGGLIDEACKRYNCTEKELFCKNLTFKTLFDPKIIDTTRKLINETDIDANIRVMILDNRSGGIMCDETNGDRYINVKRSPGSTIKPFLSYASALEAGYNPMHQINDIPTDFDGYAPQNYKNIYRGYLSLRDCLIYSSNIAAVKLYNDVGADNAVKFARSFGIDIADDDNALPISLGGSKYGFTLPELANAYRTLANGGIYSPVHYINDGQNAYFSKKIAVSDDTAYILTDILKECANRGTAKKLKDCGIIAAKTGTNGDASGNKDCYCIAYTPDVTIAVWFGANDKPIDNGITGATCCKLIRSIVLNCDLKTDVDFDMPNTVAYYDIDSKELAENHEVYLADPHLEKRYRQRALLSKKHLPNKKYTDYLDYYDGFWDGFDFNSLYRF